VFLDRPEHVVELGDVATSASNTTRRDSPVSIKAYRAR